MSRIGGHHAEYNFRRDTAGERSDTFAGAGSATPANLGFAQKIVPKWRSLVHPAGPKKFIAVVVESDLGAGKRFHIYSPTRLLPRGQSDARSAQKCHFR